MRMNGGKNRKLHMVRQGDVLLVAIDPKKIPAGARLRAKDNGRVILAYGEVTGHSHRVEGGNAALLDAPDGSVYLTIDQLIGGASIVHEEHGTIPLTRPAYKQLPQREYTPGELRQVAD